MPEKDLKKYQPKKAKLHQRTRKRHARYGIDEHTSIRDYIPLFKKALDIIKNKRD